MKYLLLIISAGMFLTGCAGNKVYYEVPADLRTPQKKAEFLIRYTPYLAGKKIFLDPGHGGKDRTNKGPTEAVEADLNLKVSLYLRDFLRQAGAIVFMSREKDTTVDLKERSYMANQSGADIFISIHHNAPGDSLDTWTNYTSTYYHALETDFEYEPNERDLARFIQRDLSYAMRNSGGPGSFDGTYSDYIRFPGQGYSVLRVTEIPSVLVECGFHTNLYEEQRLIIDEFNRIEAWGIFRGVARYFAAGVPKITYTGYDSIPALNAGQLYFKISDSTGIDTESVIVHIDSVITKKIAVSEDGNLIIMNDSTEPGTHTIRISAANKNKNHSFPYYKKITIY